MGLVESALLLSLSCLALIAYVLRYGSSAQVGVTQDDAAYVVLAESFATGRPYRIVSYPEEPPEEVYPPGYPLLILTVPWLFFGPNYDLMRLLNGIFVLLCSVVGYWILRRFLSHQLALVSVGLFFLNPRVIGLATSIMSDIPFTFFFLVFALLFLKWSVDGRYAISKGIGIVVFLAAAIITRYWGIAFSVAASLYLVRYRRWSEMLFLNGGVLVLMSPFLFILLLQSGGDISSYRAVAIAPKSLATLAANFALSLQNYWQATPLLLVPVFGPTLTDQLQTVGFGWVVSSAHTLILLVLCFGFVKLSRVQPFLAIVVVSYLLLLMVLTARREGTIAIFDEPRYLVPVLLILYGLLVLGLRTGCSRVMTSAHARLVFSLIVIMLITISFLRNIQQSAVQFSIVDLATAAEWAQEYTVPEAVFMTPDPVSRYLYLRRQTVGYPSLVDQESFWNELVQSQARFLMIAPPLAINYIPNTDQVLDPNVERVLVPAVQERNDCFSMVFQDRLARTTVYEILSDCPRLHVAPRSMAPSRVVMVYRESVTPEQFSQFFSEPLHD